MEHTHDTPRWGGRWRPLLIGLEGVCVLGPALLLALSTVTGGFSSLRAVWERPGDWRAWSFALGWWLGAVVLCVGGTVYLRLMAGESVPSRLLVRLAVLGAAALAALMIGVPAGPARWMMLPLVLPVLVCGLRAATARTGERG